MTANCHCDHSRRAFLGTAALGSLTLLLGGFGAAWASGQAAELTPDQALQRLKDGNARFLSGDLTRTHLTKERLLETYKGGQHPFATVIGCSDSRVPVEELFDQGVGDLFIIRIAGNVVHTDETGSTEYGTVHLGTPLVLVLGHTRCGAVTAVVKGEKVGGSIPKLVETIAPAVERSRAKGLGGDALVEDAIRENVRESMAALLGSSAEIAALVKEGKLKVVGAIYHIDDGRVEWL